MAGGNGRAYRSGLTCFQRVLKYSGRYRVRSEDVLYDLGVRDDGNIIGDAFCSLQQWDCGLVSRIGSQGSVAVTYGRPPHGMC